MPTNPLHSDPRVVYTEFAGEPDGSANTWVAVHGEAGVPDDPFVWIAALDDSEERTAVQLSLAAAEALAYSILSHVAAKKAVS